MNNHIVNEWAEACEKGTQHDFFDKYPLDNRVLRLFAVACCREVWNEFTDERSKKAVETAELYADGLTSKDELAKARTGAWYAWINSKAAAYTACAFTITTRHTNFFYLASAVAKYTSHSRYTPPQYTQQGLIIAQMYPTTFNNNYINPTTKSLAQQIYNNKDFSLMPILADALQDVNCTEDILEHLRSKGPFYKGNYIIDVLTGKRTTKARTT